MVSVTASPSMPLAPNTYGAFAGSISFEEQWLNLGESLANHGVAVEASLRMLPDSVTLLLLAVVVLLGCMASQVDIAEFTEEAADEQRKEKEKSGTTSVGEINSEPHSATEGKTVLHALKDGFQDDSSLWRLHLLAPALAVLAKLWTPSLCHSLEDPWLGLRDGLLSEMHGMALQELSVLTNMASEPWIPFSCILWPLLWLLGLLGIAASRDDIIDFMAAEDAADNAAKDPSRDDHTAQTCPKGNKAENELVDNDKHWKKQPLDASASRLYTLIPVLIVLASPIFLVLADLSLVRSIFE
jgi:hypothetical protein